MNHIVVVGAGLAGLSAGCYLTGAGHRVTILESGPVVGGRLSRWSSEGYTFDTGATVFTMAGFLDDALRQVGASVAEHAPMKLLDPAYRAVYRDGSEILVRHGHEAMRDEIATHCGPKDAASFDEFVDWLGKLYEAELPHFIDANFNTPLDLLRSPAAALKLVRLGGFTSLGHQIRKRFDDERLHRLFSFQAMYAGLSPDQALAIYAVITYMDSVEGVYFPEGGMRAVPDAMAAALRGAGAQIRCDAPVAELLRRADGTVSGVALADGERVAADAVVVTVDPPHAFNTLLADLKPPRVLRRPDYSPSCVVWHVGLDSPPPPGTQHHNIYFGDEWAGAFDDLLTKGTLMRDPSRLVTVHSLDDPGAAPEGGSTLYVLEPTPNLDVGRIDWPSERGAMRDRLEAFVRSHGYGGNIVTEQLVTPEEWAADGLGGGTPFALAHTFTQTGPFRVPNVYRGTPGLVLAGSGTVPGVGIPMVMISGKLAAQRVAEMLR